MTVTARPDPAPASPPSSAAPSRPCPACGAEWPDEIRYCGECGGRMPDATLVNAPYKVQVEATDAAPPGVISEALIPTLVPRDERREDGDRAAPFELLDVERLESSALATPLLVAPEPHTLPEVSTLDTGILAAAWRLVRARLGVFAVGTLVVNLASSALSSLVIGLLALGPLHGGLAIAALRAASGRRVKMNDFFDGFASFDLAKRLAVTWLLTTSIVSLGFVLLLVPGLYLAMATAYAPFLVVDRGMAPWAAIRMSIEHVNARLQFHVVLWAIFIAVLFVAALPCGLGLLVALPLVFVTLALCYSRIFGIRG